MKISKRIICSECKSFLIEYKENGDFIINDKLTKFSNGPTQTKFVCQCKKKYIIEKVIQYNIFIENPTLEKK